MKDKSVIGFDSFEEDHSSQAQGEKLHQPSLTIDLDGLFSEYVSTSGSFDIRSKIWTTTFGKLTQALPIPVMLVNKNLEIVVANQAWSRIYSHYRELHGTNFCGLFPQPASIRKAEESLKEVFSTRRPSESESFVVIGGNRLWVRMTFRSIRISGRRLALVVFENLSAEKSKLALERKLRAQVEKAKGEWERTFNSIPDLIMILDTEHKILRANKPLAEKLGVGVQDLVGSPCYQFLHGTNAPPERCPFRKVREDGKPYSQEGTFKTLEGEYEVTVSPIFDTRGNLDAVVHICRDITERKQVERDRQRLLSDLTKAKKDLAFRAAHDSLTGLANRPAILGILNKELARSVRESSPLGVILVDVDHFKRINDENGHLAGDAVLRAIASRIKTSMRPYDSVGRYGGEEFIIVVPGCDKARVLVLSERLRKRFHNNPIRTAEGDFSVTLSLGAYVVQGTLRIPIESVIRNVDKALYRAKELGRNRVELMDSKQA